jgi:hypothetical protein
VSRNEHSCEEKRLAIRHGTGLYVDILSLMMYSFPLALWELIKNAWDAGVRRGRNIAGPFRSRIELITFEEHPLSPRSPALIILDNGEGMTQPSLERFLTIGADAGVSQTHGMTDQKRIGRLAAFSLLQNQSTGFYVLSSTGSVAVDLYHVTPESLSGGYITQQVISRQDSRLVGRCPKGSFTMFVLPGVVRDVMSIDNVQRDLEWLIPRPRACAENTGMTLLFNGAVIQPPPLALKLKLEFDGIVGYFERDTRKNPQGIRLCDSATNTQVSAAVRTRDIVYPCARPEITGDLFIPGLIENQNSSRDGLSPAFLRSSAWQRIQQILWNKFREPLCELLGDDGVVRSVVINRATNDVVSGFNKVWNKPKRQNVPSGVTPPRPDEVPGGNPLDDADSNLFPNEPGEAPSPAPGSTTPAPPADPPGTALQPVPGSEPPSETGAATPETPALGTLLSPQRKRRPMGKAFNYKGQTYILGLSKLPSSTRAFYAPGANRIFLNQDDPLLKLFGSASAALKLHIATSIITAIESQSPENQGDAQELITSVNTSLNLVLGVEKPEEETLE